jgi:hypothetical protein
LQQILCSSTSFLWAIISLYRLVSDIYSLGVLQRFVDPRRSWCYRRVF